MKKILLITTLLVLPFISSASTIPKFPMAFYGTATINNVTAPAGTVVRAYYGNTLVGQSTTDESGTYGYASSTEKKLLVSEGVGPITFTFQTSSVLSGQESLGSIAVSYSGFEEGVSKLDNLNFTYTVPVVNPPTVVTPPAPNGNNRGSGGGTPRVASTTGKVLGATNVNWANLPASERATIIKLLQTQLLEIIKILNDMIADGSLK